MNTLSIYLKNIQNVKHLYNLTYRRSYGTIQTSGFNNNITSSNTIHKNNKAKKSPQHTHRRDIYSMNHVKYYKNENCDKETRALSTTKNSYENEYTSKTLLPKERHDYYEVSEQAAKELQKKEALLSRSLKSKSSLQTRNRLDIADARRLSFRLSTELPRHFLLYFNKGIGANVFTTNSTVAIDKNIRKFLRGLDRQAKNLKCMPIFSELALFLDINLSDTPHLNRWRNEQARNI